MIRKTIPFFFCSMMLVAMLSACGNGKDGDSKEDIVEFKTVKMADKSSFKRSNGEMCQIKIDATIALPEKYKGAALSAKLQNLITSTLFEGGDSLQQSQALQQMLKSRLAVNVHDESEALAEDESAAVSNISIKINISPVFNTNGILSMCFEETITKDGVTSPVHSYFNYDLEKCALVDMGEFNDQLLADMAQLLQNKLMEQNKVTSAEELNALGYFDIFNISVTSNFYFSNEGLVWSYKPQELTADAKVEPTILIPYSDLSPYVKEESVIKKMM